MNNSKNNYIISILAFIIAGVGYKYSFIPGFAAILIAVFGVIYTFFIFANNLTQKTSAFLIIVFVFSLILYGIYYFFIANVGNLIVNVGELKGVKIVINGNFGNREELLCDNKCIFKGIPPIDYTIIATKTGYKVYEQSLSLNRGDNKEISIVLKKDVVIEEDKLSKEEKLKILKYNKLYSELKEKVGKDTVRNILGTYESKIYSYDNNEDIFNIYESDGTEENNIYTQKNIKGTNVTFNQVDGIIIFSADSKHYFYDINKKISYKVDLIDIKKINIIKSTIVSSKYIINSPLGNYLFDTESNILTKNTFFDDFTIIGDGKIVGIIYPESKKKLQILNFTENSNTKIILHDIGKIERKVIHEVSTGIKYIFYKNSELKYLDNNMKLYSLKQLDIE